MHWTCANSSLGSRFYPYWQQPCNPRWIQASWGPAQNMWAESGLPCPKQLLGWHPCSGHRHLHLVKTANLRIASRGKVWALLKHLRQRYHHVWWLDAELRQPWQARPEEGAVRVLPNLVHRRNVLEERALHWKPTHIEIWTHSNSHWATSSDLRRLGVLKSHKRNNCSERIQLDQTSERLSTKLNLKSNVIFTH